MVFETARPFGFTSGMAAWIFWVVAGWLGVLGVALAWLGLFRDRSRGRRRCPRCWYSMEGVPGLVCPECGADARREARLLRTRRRPPVAVLGVVLLAGAVGAWLTPRVTSRGWLSLAPTTALLLASPPAGEEAIGTGVAPGYAAPIAELIRRGAVEEMAGWQWRLYLRRAGVIEAPGAWPEGEPVPVRVTYPSWWTPELVEIRVRDPGSDESHRAGLTQTLVCGIDSGFGQPPSHLMVEGGETITLGVSVRTGKGAADPAVHPRVLWEGAMSFPVRRVSDAGEIVRGSAGASLERAIHAGVTPSLIVSTPTRSLDEVLVALSVSPSLRSRAPGLAYGFGAVLERDGEVVQSSSFPTLELLGGARPPTFAVEDERLARALRSNDGAEIARWTLRLTGDPRQALYDWERREVWSGEIEIPLVEILNPS